MATPVLDIPDWVKKARAWTSATKMNQAEQSYAQAGMPAPVQQIARQIAGLYEGMRYGAEDAADQYDARSAAARKAMMDQFTQTDAATKAAYGNSQNYQSEIAKRLGLEQVLQGPGVENQNQQTNQVLALNNANRTNQMASYDLLKGGYGEILRDRLGSFDVGAGTTLANLLATLQAQAAEAAAAKGGGGGGRGGGGGYGDEEGDLSGFGEEQQTFASFNPYNMPTQPIQRRPLTPQRQRQIESGFVRSKQSKYAAQKASLGKTSRAYSLTHKVKRG